MRAVSSCVNDSMSFETRVEAINTQPNIDDEAWKFLRLIEHLQILRARAVRLGHQYNITEMNGWQNKMDFAMDGFRHNIGVFWRSPTIGNGFLSIPWQFRKPFFIFD